MQIILAELQRVEGGYRAIFERHLMHSVKKVWSMLTENDKLVQWFSELEVEGLREGGVIKFNMPDGTYLDLEIKELSTYSVLEYTWAEDRVRFELYPDFESEGCRLVLIEKISKITDHTSKDLAGWHVCLDVINVLLDGNTLDSRDSIWKIEYEKYKVLVENFLENQGK